MDNWEELRKYLESHRWTICVNEGIEQWYVLPSVYVSWPINIRDMYRCTDYWDLSEAVRLQKYIDYTLHLQAAQEKGVHFQVLTGPTFNKNMDSFQFRPGEFWGTWTLTPFPLQTIEYKNFAEYWDTYSKKMCNTLKKDCLPTLESNPNLVEYPKKIYVLRRKSTGWFSQKIAGPKERNYLPADEMLVEKDRNPYMFNESELSLLKDAKWMGKPLLDLYDVLEISLSPAQIS